MTTMTSFDVEGTLAFLNEGHYKRVALQLPNDLLPHARSLCEALSSPPPPRLANGGDSAKNDNERLVFVLGDSSYSECCADEVAALHYGADCVIHYGRSCFSRPSRLPVYLVFGETQWNLSSEAIESIVGMVSPSNSPGSPLALGEDGTTTQAKTQVLVVPDARLSLESVRRLQSIMGNYSNASVAFVEDPPRVLLPLEAAPKIDTPLDTHQDDSEMILGRKVVVGESFTTRILYIGDPDFFPLTQLSLRYANVSIFDVRENKRLTHEFNLSRTLARRYHFIEKAKTAKMIGIVVGTMSVSGYFEAVQRARALIAQAGKKSYTFLVGKLNPAKLANFTEIDVFVMISCPQSTLVDDLKKEFFKPVITPFELKLALTSVIAEGKREESGIDDQENGGGVSSSPSSTPSSSMYEFDFQKVLKHLSTGASAPAIGSKEKAPPPSSSNSTLAKSRREADNKITLQYSSPYADAMALKAFKGLERSAGEAKPAPAAEGRRGVAWAYDGEG